MSNYMAIATVTKSLVQILTPGLEDDVPGATVTTVRPDGSGNGTPEIGVNLYLFQVTPNAALRNADLPTRNSNGDLVQRPRVALDLHYLLTFYGSDILLQPQLVLGSVVRTLHATPYLSRQVIRDVVAANSDLAESNLADEIELVKFTPIMLSLEELSQLWSVFFQIPYTLSVAYQGSVVLIEGEEAPRSVLPVRERNLYVKQFRQPFIEEVRSLQGANRPIVVGDTLVVRGQQLRGDDTQLRVGGVDVTSGTVTDTEISVPLTEPPFPADSLRAGVQGVQVVHRLLLGTPSVPHHGFASNVVPFALRPIITDVDVTTPVGDGLQVIVFVNPKVRPGQRVTLLLNEMTDQAPQAYTFFVEPLEAESALVTIPISGVEAGDYLVRVQVDGAESSLEVHYGQYTGPKVTIP